MTDTLTNGDRRQAIVDAYEESGRTATHPVLADRFGVSTKTVGRALAATKNGQVKSGVTTSSAPTLHDTAASTARFAVPRGGGVTRKRTDWLDKVGRPLVGWAVTLLALVFSYSRMRHLAELAGVSWPQLAPLLVDGLLATAVLCLRRNRDYWAARLALGLSVLAGVALNVLAERPDLVALKEVRLWWALMIPATAAFGVHLVTKR